MPFDSDSSSRPDSTMISDSAAPAGLWQDAGSLSRGSLSTSVCTVWSSASAARFAATKASSEAGKRPAIAELAFDASLGMQASATSGTVVFAAISVSNCACIASGLAAMSAACNVGAFCRAKAFVRLSTSGSATRLFKVRSGPRGP